MEQMEQSKIKTEKEKSQHEKKRGQKEGKVERPLTLDEQIEQKKKEIEEIERKYNIYYSPAVQDLLGLYYKEKYKGLKKMKKELKELEKKKEKGEEGTVEEPVKEEEKPAIMSISEQLETVDKSLKSIYGKIGYRKRRIREGGVLGRAALEKEITGLEKERNKLKKRKRKIKEHLTIEKRLKKISKKIEQGGVLGRSKLEKEQRKLEKKLKKLEKK